MDSVGKHTWASACSKRLRGSNLEHITPLRARDSILSLKDFKAYEHTGGGGVRFWVFRAFQESTNPF